MSGNDRQRVGGLVGSCMHAHTLHNASTVTHLQMRLCFYATDVTPFSPPVTRRSSLVGSKGDPSGKAQAADSSSGGSGGAQQCG